MYCKRCEIRQIAFVKISQDQRQYLKKSYKTIVRIKLFGGGNKKTAYCWGISVFCHVKSSRYDIRKYDSSPLLTYQTDGIKLYVVDAIEAHVVAVRLQPASIPKDRQLYLRRQFRDIHASTPFCTLSTHPFRVSFPS